MSQSRQLAAIMFTDIDGYTKLMGEDEALAVNLLRRNRQIQKPLIAQYQGRWLKEIGDGVLASFLTVSDAVYCAGAIQKACAAEPNLKLRIGIHLGEVIFEDGDVFGDGVNIASRLESMAPVGGILVSGAVNSNLVNKKGIDSKFIDERTLKNVKNPIKLYEVNVRDAMPPEHFAHKTIKPVETAGKPRLPKIVLISTLLIPLLAVTIYLIYSNRPESTGIEPSSSLALGKSIAVLPFSDFSQNKDQDWFSDGLTEELLNCLTRLPELQVTARTSSFAFKGKDLPVQLIADSLGVNYLLEGSVRKSGNILRVTAQLIDPKQDAHLWTDTYDRELKDVFVIQEDIANNIARSLNIYLDDTKRNQMFAFGTRNPTAYEYYLQGNVLFDKAHTPGGNVTDLAEANYYYEKATGLDPDFAAPWYRHQDVYSHLLTLTSDEYWPDTLTKEVAMSQILQDVNMAKSKAKGRAEALFYEMEYAMVSSNWSQVPALFEELERNPEYLGLISHFGGGWSPSLFIALERTDLGLKVAARELANDPLSSFTDKTLMRYLAAENQKDSAVFWSQKQMKTGQEISFLGLLLESERAQEVIDELSDGDNNGLLFNYAKAIKGGYELPEDFDKNLNTPGRQFMATYLYSFRGNQAKADSLANALDSRFMGSFTISDRIINMGGKIRFNLNATPNFAARLREGGIKDLAGYQKRHWALLPD